MTPDAARKARSTARWRRLRSRVLDADPLCRHCGNRDQIVGAEEVDHIVPIRAGGEFWSRRNLQPLCRRCHERKTARENLRRKAPICRHGYGPGECRRCTDAE